MSRHDRDLLPDGWTHTGATHCTHTSGAEVFRRGVNWHYCRPGFPRVRVPGSDFDGVEPSRARAMAAALDAGRRSLLAVLQRTTAREVAARCRVSPSRVSEWASGAATPSRRARAVLEGTYGIAAPSWASRSRRLSSVSRQTAKFRGACPTA